jgi:hypothetical protein
LIQRNWKLHGASEAEKNMWTSLISSCLAFFPQQRPTAEELCRHVLFSTYNVVYGENVVQYAPRTYDPAEVSASSHKVENKASVLELLSTISREVHAHAEQAHSPVNPEPKSGMRNAPASVVFPADLDADIKARYEAIPIASDSGLDDAIRIVLSDLEKYTHNTSVSQQLRSLLNYFIALKAMHVEGEDDTLPPFQIEPNIS